MAIARLPWKYDATWLCQASEGPVTLLVTRINKPYPSGNGPGTKSPCFYKDVNQISCFLDLNRRASTRGCCRKGWISTFGCEPKLQITNHFKVGFVFEILPLYH